MTFICDKVWFVLTNDGTVFGCAELRSETVMYYIYIENLNCWVTKDMCPLEISNDTYFLIKQTGYTKLQQIYDGDDGCFQYFKD